MAVLTIFTELCNYHQHLISGHFITPERNPISTSQHSPMLPLFSPWHLLTYFLSLSLPILDSSYKWNQYTVFCIWFLSLSIMFSWFTHTVAYTGTSFLLMANHTPLYGYSTFCLSIHQLTDIAVFSNFWLLGIMLL